MGPDVTAIVVVTLICTTLLIAQVLRAVLRRVGRPAIQEASAAELAQLRDRLAEVEAVAARVPELEERVDFAERLLSTRDDAARLSLHRTPV